MPVDTDQDVHHQTQSLSINRAYEDMGLPDNTGSVGDSADLTIEVPHKGLEVTLNNDLGAENEGPCSWGPFAPRFCQVFLSPKVFLVCICWAGAIQGMVVNGFISVVISTIERRFDLNSTESGFIASSYDMASVLCLIPVSYFGGSGCKPRWIGIGVLLLGLGSLMFALPHFTTPKYDYEHVSSDNICVRRPQHDLVAPPAANSVRHNISHQSPVHPINHQETPRITYCDTFVPKNETNLWKYKYMFIFAQLFHGMGATPLYTLGVTYMDENLKTKVTPVYVGVFYGMVIVGPALGYLFGGELLKYYTDIDVMYEPVSITPENPKWIGMWWLGFLLAGLTAFVVAIPIFGFPNSLPGSSALKSQRVSEVCHSVVSSASSTAGSIRDIPKTLGVLLTNPTFMFLNLAGASEGMLMSGFTVFTPKFIESQFSIPAGWAAQLVGFATIPAGGGGTFLGGYIVKRFDLRCAGIIRWCMCSSFASFLFLMVFLIQCTALPFAGVSVDYTQVNASLDIVNLTSQCNAACDCDPSLYNPVCGTNGVTYYSACHAGCTEASEHMSNKVYADCRCIGAEPPGTGNQPTGPLSASSLYESVAYQGKCESSCQLLILFLPTFFLTILCTFTTTMPALSATLRCVPESHRSLSLGIQWILIRCLGTIPAPILFGTLIDVTCRLWQHKCATDSIVSTAEGGACLFYDNKTMGRYLMGVALVMKLVSFSFFALSLFSYRPPPGSRTSSTSRATPSCVRATDEQLSTSSTMQMIVREPKSPHTYGGTGVSTRGSLRNNRNLQTPHTEIRGATSSRYKAVPQ